MTDRELLQQHVHGDAGEAMRQLVHRHIDLVYSAALRQLRNLDLAQDITQIVFLVLHRRARHIPENSVLAGWLVKTTYFACRDLSKREARRRKHERRAAEMARATETTPVLEQQEVIALIDSGLARLSAVDRNALVLRFFEKKSVAEVAKALKTSEGAAGKRIARGLEKLRKWLAHKGIDAPMPMVMSVLMSSGKIAAPKALSETIVKMISGGAAMSHSLASGATRVIRAMLIGKVALVSCVLLTLGAAITVGAVTRSGQEQQTTKIAAVPPWELLMEAGQLPTVESPRASNMEYWDYPPYSKEWMAMARNSEDHNKPVLDLLRKARLRMQSNGGRAATPKDVQIILPSLNAYRNLTNIVSDGAILEHLYGNDSKSLDRILDHLNISDCLRQSDLLVSQLVAIGIDAMGTNTINIVAPGLEKESLRSAAPAATQPRLRQQVIELIAWLRDEKSADEALQRALREELTHGIVGGPANAPVRVKPAEVSPTSVELVEKACIQPDFPAAQAIVAKCVWAGQMSPLTKSMDRLFNTHFRVIMERRMSAVILAAQLYRADHQGAWPKALSELVPMYLSEVPRDPFRADGAALGYRVIPHGWPEGGDRPVIFSDSGPDVPVPASPVMPWYVHGKEIVRQYLDLSAPGK